MTAVWQVELCYRYSVIAWTFWLFDWRSECQGARDDRHGLRLFVALERLVIGSLRRLGG